APALVRVGAQVRGGGVAHGVRRGEGGGGDLPPLGDALDDGLPVDGEVEGAAHPGVLEVRHPHVQAVVVDAEVGGHLQQLGVVAAVDGDLVDGDGAGDVQLPGPEHALLGGDILDGVGVDAVEA